MWWSEISATLPNYFSWFMGSGALSRAVTVAGRRGDQERYVRAHASKTYSDTQMAPQLHLRIRWLPLMAPISSTSASVSISKNVENPNAS